MNQDKEKVRSDLRRELEQVRASLRDELEQVRQNLTTEREQVRQQLTSQLEQVRAELHLDKEQVCQLRQPGSPLFQTVTDLSLDENGQGRQDSTVGRCLRESQADYSAEDRLLDHRN